MARTRFVPGQRNAHCPVCGFVYKSGKFRLRWDNVRVCEGCWNPRHPQEYVVPNAAERAPAWTSPEPPDTFSETTGIGWWQVEGTFAIPPYDRDTEPVEFEQWINEVWTIRFLVGVDY